MTANMPLVTEDPELEAQLRERIDDLSSSEMAEYARSLGLTPPVDVRAPVVLHWQAGADIESPGEIVWDLRPDE